MGCNIFLASMLVGVGSDMINFVHNWRLMGDMIICYDFISHVVIH